MGEQSDEENLYIDEIKEMDTLDMNEYRDLNINRPSKRNREEDESDEEWKIAGPTGKGKRLRQYNSTNRQTNKLEVTISCTNKLPKSFALAKLFKTHNINNIVRVQYLNPYRVRIQFEDDLNMNKLCSCEALLTNGWRVHKDMEVSFSYGVIKDVDLDMEENEILKSITCPDSKQLISVKRLNRRAKEGWTPCEVIKLCFKGSSLPPYVYTDGLRIKVEPYVFPVSQCSQCWRFGHITKTCPTNKIVCPKCGGYHSNCDTKIFRCVNCSGKHMAIEKTCPSFLKEKKLRDIMAEFNCTYKRAITMYVPTTSPRTIREESMDSQRSVINTPANLIEHVPTFAEIVKVTADVQEQSTSNYQELNTSTRSNKGRSKKKKRRNDNNNSSTWNTYLGNESDSSLDKSDNVSERVDDGSKGKPDFKITFNELLLRLKEVIFLNNCSLQVKVKQIFKLCIEWLILLVVDNLTDLPLLHLFMNILNGQK